MKNIWFQKYAWRKSAAVHNPARKYNSTAAVNIGTKYMCTARPRQEKDGLRPKEMGLGLDRRW